MTQPGLVTVMMPAYNAAPYIGQAIESVLAQRYAAWELIIVNDGSTDQTAEIAAAYVDPRIRLVHQANGGESVARNRALELARGEFVAFLDADDLFLPHHLAATVAYLQHTPSVDGVYTDGHYCDSEGSPTELLSSQRRGPFQGWLFEELVLASDVFGPPTCVVLRQEAIAQRQLRFDPAIVIGPDWDFFTRCAEATRFGYLDQRTCLYRVHQTNITLRTTLHKRADSLAQCRQKAIKLQNFSNCAPQTRVAVFYDLLVNLRRGFYPLQDEISGWPEFTSLPKQQRARLLRLMASKNLGESSTQTAIERRYIAKWLTQARALSPLNPHTNLLYTLHRISPNLCKSAINLKQWLTPDVSHSSPFGKLA
ncbi:MAG: glycosyltransferase family 2 protein [Caldilineaceae bacterium]|nr:glycosyltransferase family 2 protein [Caldilineaceae bacterium]